MRSASWFLVIITLALSGGLVAFLLATPDQGVRVQSAQLGFRGLTQAEVAQAAERAAAYHRGLARSDAAQRNATRAARAWLQGLPADARATPQRLRVRPGAATGATRARVAAFVEWADGIPAPLWATTVQGAVRTTPAYPARDRFEVRGVVALTLVQASTRVHTQRVPVTVQLEGVAAPRGAAPASWLVRDVEVGGKAERLRAYLDPVVIHRTAIDVVAPTALRAEAVATADLAQSALPALRTRYGSVGGSNVATVWMVDDVGRVQATLGSPAPRTTLVAAAGSPHAFAWVDPRDDVVVALDRAMRAPVAVRRAELRRELALLAIGRAVGTAPPVLVEGAAAWELRRADPPAGWAHLQPVHVGFEGGAVDLGALLHAAANRPLAPGSKPAARAVALLTGEATVAYIEDVHGHAALVRLLTQLRTGTGIEPAVRAALRTDIPRLEARVAAWVAERAAPDPAPTAPDDETAGDVAPTPTADTADTLEEATA